jgi:Holliday junction DNA helicase RuvA
MIGKLRGKLIEKQPPCLIIELSNGLGYELESPMSTFYRLPELGADISLYTHQVVREDAHLLYGFYDAQERSLFRTLIKVNGVGPKLALTILSSFEPQAFIQCIHHGDSARLTGVPGIGKKTAERLVIEMRDRFKDEVVSPVAVVESAEKEAVSALIALGYKPQEASRMVSKVSTADATCETLIRLALQGAMA